MPGRHVLRYAVAVGDDDPYALVDDAFLPLLVATGSGTGARPATGSALTVTGAQVSAVRRDRRGGRLEVRVFNPTRRGGHRRPRRAHRLAGRPARPPAEPVTGSFRLRPWGIATVHLDGP